MSDPLALDEMSLAKDPMLAGLLASAPPRIPAEHAEAVLREHWGIDGQTHEIACERDQNFRVETTQGIGYVLKLSNPQENPQNTNFQTEALRWVERTDPTLPVPRVVATREGHQELTLKLPDGRYSVVRVLSWIDGTPLYMVGITPAMQEKIGTILARLGRALCGFKHPGARHAILWDIRNTTRLRPLTDALEKDGVGAMVREELEHFESEVAPRLSRLRRQIVHNDLNHHNIIVDPDDVGKIAGILDFGDLVDTHLAIDVAVAASYLANDDEPLTAVCRMVRAYHALTPLEREEILLLRDLIVARLVTSITITNWRAARYPDNAEYILRNNGPARSAMLSFAALPRNQVNQALLHACEME